jgi:hypothetical protein
LEIELGNSPLRKSCWKIDTIFKIDQVYKHIATIWQKDEKEDSFFANKWKVTKFYKTFYKEKVESFLNFERIGREKGWKQSK